MQTHPHTHEQHVCMYTHTAAQPHRRVQHRQAHTASTTGPVLLPSPAKEEWTKTLGRAHSHCLHTLEERATQARKKNLIVMPGCIIHSKSSIRHLGASPGEHQSRAGCPGRGAGCTAGASQAGAWQIPNWHNLLVLCSRGGGRGASSAWSGIPGPRAGEGRPQVGLVRARSLENTYTSDDMQNWSPAEVSSKQHYWGLQMKLS